MRQRKLQVFLSSTYTDLIDERLAAIEAILAAGHIPAAMEQFTLGDEDAWAKIKRWIDESDAYILILGGRYGSIEPESEKSYVELEYEYALNQNKPFMSIVVNVATHEARVKKMGLRVDERNHQDKLRVFREFVTKKHCAFWDDIKDIKASIFQKLPEWQARPELNGWIRAEEAASPETINELARLSKENSELREKLSTSRVEFDGLSFEALVKILRGDELRQFLLHPESFAKMSDGFQKEYAFYNPKNVGQLFELTMRRLAQGEVDSVTFRLSSDDKDEELWLEYNLSSLLEYGLAERKRRQEENRAYYTNVHNLTDVGMRFKNSLLAYGDLETRFVELWSVEV
ncbi:hypothetical protein BH24DEI2_BH24DEI2_26680 [soil metagenome]